MLATECYGDLSLTIGRFRFDYDYKVRHVWRKLRASFRAGVIKS